ASADYVVMSKEAELFLTAPFITKANGDKTANAGTAENAAAGGVASIVCDNEEASLAETRKLITMLPQNNLAAIPLFDFAETNETIDVEGCPKLIVKAIADADSTIELNPTYGKGIYTFLGTMAGVTTGFVTTSKNNPIDAATCSKAARFVKTCDAFNIPLVTFIDTAGFEMSADVSNIREIAKLASAYAESTTAKISVVTGRAFGPAFVALGSKNSNSDVTIAWPTAQISALAPDTAVEFLWSDKKTDASDAKSAHEALVAEYIDTVASPFEAAKGGYVETVIAPQDTRGTLINMLDMLAGKRESKFPKKHATV
ncbi:MAG: carboxyl transferase domain-containing protein, partial [Oscillospiraceae bacterium]